MRFRLVTCSILMLGLATPLAAQTPPSEPPNQPAAAAPAPPPFKISGYMFGDFYWVAQNHRPDLKNQSGFWFRRIYFTYDHTLSKAFTARFRLEMNSAGDFKSNSKLTPYIKDAYVRWTRGTHNIVFGISPTPTWEVVESIWGYRSVEKTPLDLQKFDTSRDFGVAFQGSLDAKSKVRYHVMVGNSSDTGSETDKNKTVRGSLGYRATSGWLVEGYADWQDRADLSDWSTVQGFVAYQKPAGRLGLQFVQQARRSATGGKTQHFEVLSAFGVRKLSDKTFVFGRVDRMFDPNPDGEKISYLPFSSKAKSTLVLLGIDILPDKSVHVMPNIELVRYDKVGGIRPGTDVVPRVTVYFTW